MSVCIRAPPIDCGYNCTITTTHFMECPTQITKLTGSKNIESSQKKTIVKIVQKTLFLAGQPFLSAVGLSILQYTTL